jgi:hypothetical protein
VIGRAYQVGDQVLSRVRALAGEQFGQVAHDARRSRDCLGRRLGRGRRGEQRGKPAPQLTLVRFRDAEQLADHRERQRKGEALNQVHDRVAARIKVVQQPVDDRLNARPQRLDPWPAECARGQPAQPGMVGRVDAEHVPGEGRAGQAFGDHRAVTGECGVHVLRQVGVAESGLRLLVADDQPGRVPVSKRDLVHRAVGLNLCEQRERVVYVVVAPCVEGWVAHLDHLDLAETGAEQVDGGQPAVNHLAD